MAKIKWIIDPAHTLFEFRAKHIMITLVSGRYREYKGEIITEDEDFTTATVFFQAKVDSVDTRNKKRDAYIKSPDFLNAEKFPYLTFKSNNVQKAGNGFKLIGDLTIKDITVQTEFEMDYLGIKTDAMGITTGGFIVNGVINRKLWGLVWNEANETGGMFAREAVQVYFKVQLIKQE